MKQLGPALGCTHATRTLLGTAIDKVRGQLLAE